MNKVLIAAGAVAALALTSAPAFAATPTTQATATARIVQPLTLDSVQNLDLGTIVLSGTGSYTDTVGISQAGVFSCGANVTCSGTTQVARYAATGTQGQTLTVAGSASIPLVNMLFDGLVTLVEQQGIAVQNARTRPSTTRTKLVRSGS